jgi:hypothetical protein
VLQHPAGYPAGQSLLARDDPMLGPQPLLKRYFVDAVFSLHTFTIAPTSDNQAAAAVTGSRRPPCA